MNYSMETIPVIDLSGLQKDPPTATRNDGDSRFRLIDSRGRRVKKPGPGVTVLKRDIKTITTIGVHQCGVWYSLSARQIAAAHGDRDLAEEMRFFTSSACHVFAVELQGKPAVVKCVPYPFYVHHGGAMNGCSVGLEGEGLWPGNATTAPRTGADKDRCDAVLLAYDAAIRMIAADLRALGAPLQFVEAHRQTAANRRSDPGAELWGVVIECCKDLDLKMQPQYFDRKGGGRPIPLAWDPLHGVGKL